MVILLEMRDNLKHLVLGSEGQIGKYVCEELERNGEEVIRWDIVLGKEYDLVSMDCWPRLLDACREANFVHFLAYDVGGSRYLAQKGNSFAYIANNTILMERVFSALAQSKTPFYFASSQMQNMTDSAYGTLKNVGEFYTRALGGVNVRFWNVYGYESDPEKTHVITDFIKSMLTEGRIICRTDGQEVRHFTHARDAAKQLHFLTKNYEDYVNRDFVAVGSNLAAEIKMIDLAKMISRLVLEFTEQDPEEFQNRIFFSIKKDSSQSIYNEFDDKKSVPFVRHTAHTYYDLGEPIRLEAGLKEMIGLIAKDLGIEGSFKEDNYSQPQLNFSN